MGLEIGGGCSSGEGCGGGESGFYVAVELKEVLFGFFWEQLFLFHLLC